MTPCLISQRTGKRCQSCRHGDQHKPGYWKSRYWTLRQLGMCVRCKKAKATRGVSCQTCWEVVAKASHLKTAKRCRRCGEAGHFSKTCPSAAREAA